MKHNPKIVAVNESSAFAYHRAMKNRRENNMLDALELMRAAAERSPENPEYSLKLANLYAEIGCFRQSARVLLDRMAAGNAPGDCSFALIFDLLALNATDSARALSRFLHDGMSDGEFIQAFHRVMQSAPPRVPPPRCSSRREYRAFCISKRAASALQAGEIGRALRLFESCVALAPGRSDLRVQYAAALHAAGETRRALDETENALNSPRADMRARISAAQLMTILGDPDRARAILRGVMGEHPAGAELKMLVYALYDAGLYPESANCARLALQETPYDRELLHARAVALSRSGISDSRAAKYWLHILRIDPDDAVAEYYRAVAEKGCLKKIEPDCLYRLPKTECERRLSLIQACMRGGAEAMAEGFASDPEYRRAILWAAQTNDAHLRAAALLTLAGLDNPEAKSLARTILVCEGLPVRLKLDALTLAKLRQVDLGGAADPVLQDCARETDIEALLKPFTVGERALIRQTIEQLDRARTAASPMLPAYMWLAYRRNPATRSDLVPSMEAATGALTCACLSACRRKPNVRAIHRRFGGSPRKLDYYVRRFGRALNSLKGETKDEDLRF